MYGFIQHKRVRITDKIVQVVVATNEERKRENEREYRDI